MQKGFDEVSFTRINWNYKALYGLAKNYMAVLLKGAGQGLLVLLKEALSIPVVSYI